MIQLPCVQKSYAEDRLERAKEITMGNSYKQKRKPTFKHLVPFRAKIFPVSSTLEKWSAIEGPSCGDRSIH